MSKKPNKRKSSFFVGLALFSMFFGSGNLTFPLFIGQMAKDQWDWATIGFSISAVLLPFLGVIALVIHHGNTENFFSRNGKLPIGKWLIPILLTVWIPLGSAPRCISVAHAGLLTYFPQLPLWVFSLFYSAVIFLLVYKRNKLLDILGYILTPLLIASLIVLIGAGVFLQTKEFAISSLDHPVTKGLFEGYNTMDLIAACFFSVSIIKLLEDADKKLSINNRLKLLLRSSIIGILILGITYIGLIYLSSAHADKIQGIQKEQILPYLAYLLLGPQLGIVASIIVLLACVTTSCVLIIVYTDYLKTTHVRWLNHGTRMSIMVVIFSYFLSLIGFSGITSLSGPLLQVLYPIVIVFVLATIGKKVFEMIAQNSNKKKLYTKYQKD